MPEAGPRPSASPRRARRLALGLGLALAWVAGAGVAAAAEPDWAYRLSTELMSPYCPGRTLVDCPSGEADALRAWITEQARSGRTRAEVEEQLYARFGDVILQAPKASGFGVAAYVIPVLAFLAGGALVVVFLRRQTQSAAAPAPGPHAVPVDAELERLVDEELGRE